jgi:hypothetical protein
MWECALVTTADAPPEALWAVAADLPNWPAWQPGVAAVRTADGRPVLVPETGRPVRLTVAESAPPHRLVVDARLFLARARTTYEFAPAAGGTRVRVRVRLLGPLQMAYRDALGGRLDRELSAMVRRLAERARAAAPASAVAASNV